jgi:hypothetical protein
MAKTWVRPSTQIKTLDVFDDQVSSGSVLETATWSLEQLLHGVVSQINRLLNSTTPGNSWFAALVAPTTFEGGVVRGVNDLNRGLHDTERKRILCAVLSFAELGPLGGVQHIVLSASQLMANTTAALGPSETLGTVAAVASSFDTPSATDGEVNTISETDPILVGLLFDGADWWVVSSKPMQVVV